MIEIVEFLKRQPSLEDLIYCLDLIRKNGNVVVIKLDGGRDRCFYTLFITFPGKSEKDMLRVDHSDLKEAILELLNLYVVSN